MKQKLHKIPSLTWSHIETSQDYYICLERSSLARPLWNFVAACILLESCSCCRSWTFWVLMLKNWVLNPMLLMLHVKVAYSCVSFVSFVWLLYLKSLRHHCSHLVLCNLHSCNVIAVIFSLKLYIIFFQYVRYCRYIVDVQMYISINACFRTYCYCDSNELAKQALWTCSFVWWIFVLLYIICKLLLSAVARYLE